MMWNKQRFLCLAAGLVFLSPILFVSRGNTPDSSSPQYIALADSADIYIKREKWEQAERVILKALRLEPANFSNSLLLSNLGVVQTRQGRYEEALESFRLGLSLSPNSSTLRNNRARTRIITNDIPGAMEDLDVSLGNDSLQEWPLQMRGLLRISLNDLPGARHDLILLSRLYPGNEIAMSGLGRIAEKEGNPEEALRYYDEALSIKEDPETHSARILLKIGMEKFSDASAEIRKCIDKYPEDPYFYLLRGYLHRLNYRIEEAKADKKIALDKGADPQTVEHFLP